MPTLTGPRILFVKEVLVEETKEAGGEVVPRPYPFVEKLPKPVKLLMPDRPDVLCQERAPMGCAEVRAEVPVTNKCRHIPRGRRNRVRGELCSCE